jgi:MFS family permease
VVARIIGGMIALLLPLTPPLGNAVSWKSRFGLDAFAILKQRDQCVFFIVTTLLSIPLAAFYMYAPEFLKALGDERPAGTMTIAQVIETFSMLVLASVMTRFRIKTVLTWALGFSVLRFLLSALAGVDGVAVWHIAGIALHGICFTFYFVTAQVFLDRRVDPGLKSQAQGLLAMVSNGLGPLIGTLVCGWMRQTLVHPDGTGWTAYWLWLAAMVFVCLIIFVAFYRGRRQT